LRSLALLGAIAGAAGGSFSGGFRTPGTDSQGAHQRRRDERQAERYRCAEAEQQQRAREPESEPADQSEG
jgi:hypothetical protein